MKMESPTRIICWYYKPQPDSRFVNPGGVSSVLTLQSGDLGTPYGNTSYYDLPRGCAAVVLRENQHGSRIDVNVSGAIGGKTLRAVVDEVEKLKKSRGITEVLLTRFRQEDSKVFPCIYPQPLSLEELAEKLSPAAASIKS